ncbi:MAG TPA: hypothetical protein VGU21_02520, partial [Streptosporangiaceae bacterium]|nr:hypothetical protein [Streptosporangiaceae bacterium]
LGGQPGQAGQLGQPGQGQLGQGQSSQDRQTEAYPQPDAEPSDYPQNAFGGGFGQNGFGSPGSSQDGATQAYATQPGYDQDQNGYAQNGYGQNGYGQDGYPRQGYGQDAYGAGGYGQDANGQPGFEAPGAPGVPGYDDDGGPAAPGSGPRSRSGPLRGGGLSSQRLGGKKMVLYLSAAVVGVVAIVFLVIHLAKGNSGTPSASSSSTGSGTTAGGGPNAAGSYVLTQAPKVGAFPLNKAATKAVQSETGNLTGTVASALKAKKAGQPGKPVTAIYDTGGSSAFNASSYDGLIFVGYDGTYHPAAVIKIVRAHLKSSRLVEPGSHGGQMACGYNTTTGSEASECVWVTNTTFGVVEFIKDGKQAKQTGASDLALKVRQAVEVKG